MLNLSHREKLCEGAAEWNSWRNANPLIVPDLNELDVSVGHRQFSHVHGGPINLRGAGLRAANLAHATLTDANLDEAMLAKANLEHARLENARFRGADLADANLDAADVLGACFEGANLSGARLHGARNLTQAQIDAALGDEETSLPGGLVRPDHWIGSQAENPQASGLCEAVREPERETADALYELLGVPPRATSDEIKKAYRARAKSLHPDLNPDDRTVEESFKELSIGVRVLRDPLTREFYDRGDIDASGRVTVYGESRRRRERLRRDIAVYFAIPFVTAALTVAVLSWTDVFGLFKSRDDASIAIAMPERERTQSGRAPAAPLITGSTGERQGSAAPAPPIAAADVEAKQIDLAEPPAFVARIRPELSLEGLSYLSLTPARAEVETMEIMAREALPLDNVLPDITIVARERADASRTAKKAAGLMARGKTSPPGPSTKASQRKVLGSIGGERVIATKPLTVAKRLPQQRQADSGMAFARPPCKLTPACLRSEQMCGCEF